MKRTKLLLALLGLLVIMAMALSACGGGAEAPAEEPAAEEPVAEEPAEEEEAGSGIVAAEATSTPAVMEEGSAYGEAPMLAEMVAAGELPPVEERLPMEDHIFVVSPVDGIGEYGGTWHNTSWCQGMGNIEMIVANASSMPFADHSLDMVVSTGSIHHWKKPVEALNEIHRTLKPGCFALIYDIVNDTPVSILKETAHRYGRFRTIIMWLHAFEEPFYSTGNLEELARSSLFGEGSIRFVGVMCCLEMKKTR